MALSVFASDQKVGAALTTRLEKRFIQWAVPRIPTRIHSYHLTLATIPVSVLVVVCSYLAQSSIQWLWIVSGLIALQWLTDSLDGSLGRFRGEGLVRWGYYMDHFLDFIFLAALLVGYMLLLPSHLLFIQFFVFAILSAFMVNSFLAFAATNQFKIYYLGLGPTEIRLMFIALNLLLIFFGKTFLVGLMPYLLIVTFIGLCIVVYKTQKEIWYLDKSSVTPIVNQS